MMPRVHTLSLSETKLFVKREGARMRCQGGIEGARGSTDSGIQGGGKGMEKA